MKVPTAPISGPSGTVSVRTATPQSLGAAGDKFDAVHAEAAELP
jgi:hypothetical protein